MKSEPVGALAAAARSSSVNIYGGRGSGLPPNYLIWRNPIVIVGLIMKTFKFPPDFCYPSAICASHLLGGSVFHQPHSGVTILVRRVNLDQSFEWWNHKHCRNRPVDLSRRLLCPWRSNLYLIVGSCHLITNFIECHPNFKISIRLMYGEKHVIHKKKSDIF